MEIDYRPHLNSEFESLLERIHPPSVDSANKHGILLDMVQVLTDLDLVISKSYICSDGGWFMDVFHVTDQLGNKITDESLILYIQQALCASRRGKKELQTCLGREMRTRHVSTEDTALEMTGTDRPGLLSEISAALAELECHVTAAVAWTHNTRAACIIYVEDETTGGPITDSARLAHIQEQLENVVYAHHQTGERKSVRLTPPAAGRTHTERRLHQLMLADKDYEKCSSCGGYGDSGDGGVVYRNERGHGKGCDGTIVTIENCKEKGYSVVNMRSRDRPKLLFDTVCTLTDMQYVVFHAAISSMGSTAVQEYYIRHKDGCTLNMETERRRVIQCLTAAIERRVSRGLRLDVSTRDRLGLLSETTRLFRENGLSVTRAEIGTRGERAVGSFYVTDASGNNVNLDTVIEVIRQEIGATVLVVNKSSGWSPETSTSSTTRSKGNGVEDRPRFSLGSLLWSRLERLSSNFGLLKL